MRTHTQSGEFVFLIILGVLRFFSQHFCFIRRYERKAGRERGDGMQEKNLNPWHYKNMTVTKEAQIILFPVLNNLARRSVRQGNSL